MIRKLIDQGKLGHFRIGILIRIPRFAVDEFEQLNTLGGGVPAKTGEPGATLAKDDGPSPVPTAPAGPRNIARAPRRRAPFKRPSHD